MESLQKFVDDTFKIMTGIGEMKVAEAIFLESVDNASQTIVNFEQNIKDKILRKVISLAYKGQNIIKLCAYLPPNDNAQKPANELWALANQISSLVNGLSHRTDTVNDSDNFNKL